MVEKNSRLEKLYLVGLFSILILVAAVANGHEERDNEDYDMSYLQEGLKVTPIVKLMNDAHPVSYDLIGKEYHLNYGTLDKKLVAVAHVVDEHNLEWWVESDPVKKIRNVKHVVFKITEDIYYVTWVDPEGIPRGFSNTYKDNYLVAFVLDLKNRIATDSYMRPSKDGSQEWHLQQATVVVKDHN